MKRRKLLGMILALPAAAAGIAAASPNARRWADLTENERAAFTDCSRSAWNEAARKHFGDQD